jgi:anaerobic selenocysteine-containing dehydrogenase
VSTASGSCVVEVEVTDAIRRGVVSLPHAWPDADVNRLTSGRRVDPLSAMPEFSGFAVTVERRPSLAQT